MHLRIVVLSKVEARAPDLWEIARRLERRGRYDYVEPFSRLSLKELEDYDEAEFVVATYEWSGKRLRLLGPGLLVPKEPKRREYREALVFDAHI